MAIEKKGLWTRTAEVIGLNEPQVKEARSETNGDPSPGVIPPARDEYAVVSIEQALTLGAVSRSIEVITSSISQMRLKVYRDGIEIDSPRLIRDPAKDDSLNGFLDETAFSLAAYGNAYWLLYGSPVQVIEVLDPAAVTITTDKNGNKTYYYGSEEIESRRIKHLRLNRRPGYAKGFGPLQTGSKDIGAALRLREFATEWFNGEGVPKGILTTDQNLGAEQAALFVNAWKEFLKNHGGTALMTNGMRYESLNIKPAEAQYLEVQQASTIGIARLFGVPTFFLNAGVEGTSMTYVNAQEIVLMFMQNTLTKYMTEIENAFASLLPRGQNVEFDETDLLRMHTNLQTEVDVALVNAGLRTRDEIRARDNLPPLPAESTNKEVTNE